MEYIAYVLFSALESLGSLVEQTTGLDPFTATLVAAWLLVATFTCLTAYAAMRIWS